MFVGYNLISFINQGSDADIVSLVEDSLIKALDKTKLVQRDVQYRGKNGQIYTRKQWVNPKDDPSTTHRVANQDTTGHHFQSAAHIEPKSLMSQILKSKGRHAVLDFAKKNGVQWKENDNEGINWMRCSIASQKHMNANPQLWVDFSKVQNTPQDQQSKGQQDSKPQNNPNQKTTLQSNKDNSKSKVQELSSVLGRDEMMKRLKSLGISWSEHPHPGVNWMRASMSASKAIKEDTSIYDKLKQNSQNSNKLDDLVSTVPLAKKGDVKKDVDTIPDVLKGISTDTLSQYEDSHFGNIIKTAAPKSLRNYRTLGMCAADAESEAYLDRLYKDYSETLQSMSGAVLKRDPNIDSDTLRNQLQGVVNKMVVGVVKSTMSNVRKRIHQFTIQQKLLEPWTNPNISLSKEDLDELKKEKSGTKRSVIKCSMVTETDGNHTMMKRVLDKLTNNPEYSLLAKEYKEILDEYDKLTEGNILIQTYTNRPTNESLILSSLTHSKIQEEGRVLSLKREIEKYTNAGEPAPDIYIRKAMTVV